MICFSLWKAGLVLIVAGVAFEIFARSYTAIRRRQRRTITLKRK